MFYNIDRFLKSKESRIKKLSRTPLIVHWRSLQTMEKSLSVLDKKIGYLLDNSTRGSKGKLDQWLLSDDIGFCTLTAERYIIDYLKTKNKNIKDNLAPQGIDAQLINGEEKVGIEVTTLNSFVAEWIFTERLIYVISSQGLLKDKTIRIKYRPSKLLNVSLYNYIDQVAENIFINNVELLRELNIELEIEERGAGDIALNMTSEDDFPWLRSLTNDLLQKLTERNKKHQLKNNLKNVIFVGVNNITPLNSPVPSVLKEIGQGGFSYQHEIDHIKTFWEDELHHHNHISGICYFYYSLEQEGPFYPLRIFWRDDAEKIHLNL